MTPTNLQREKVCCPRHKENCAIGVGKWLCCDDCPNNPIPHNTPTAPRETVSECNEIPCTHCVYGNPSCHICHKFPTEPMTTKVEPTVEKWELREKLADIEHQRWSDWQRYVHSKCVNHSNGKGEWVCFPSELFRQWERQINTPYSELSEKEKDSDREQVDRYLPLLSHSVQEAKAEIARQLEMTLLLYQKDLDGYPDNPNYVLPLEERIKAFIKHELSTLSTKEES